MNPRKLYYGYLGLIGMTMLMIIRAHISNVLIGPTSEDTITIMMLMLLQMFMLWCLYDTFNR